jgi:hypothetical protein
MFGGSSSLSARASPCGGVSLRAAAAASATAARRAASSQRAAAPPPLRVVTTAGGDKKGKSGDKPKKKRNQLPEPPAALPAFAPPPTPSAAPPPPAPFSPLPPRSLLPRFDPSAFPGLVATAKPAASNAETGHHRFLAPQADLHALLGTSGSRWEPPSTGLSALESLPPRHRRARTPQGGEVSVCTGKHCRKDGAYGAHSCVRRARHNRGFAFCGRPISLADAPRCGAAGASELLAAFRAAAPPGVTVRECGCKGACKSAPVAVVGGDKLKVRRSAHNNTRAPPHLSISVAQPPLTRPLPRFPPAARATR